MDPMSILALANVAKDVFQKKGVAQPVSNPMSIIGDMGNSAINAYDMYKNPNKLIGSAIGDNKLGNTLYDLYMGRQKKEV